MEILKAPFPWFGGKSRVAKLVWQRFGDVPNYVEPFAGSLAVLLARPHEPRIETVNDADAYLCNFWRAVKADPDAVARYADWPVNESDLHARHLWLVNQGRERVAQLEGDPDVYDAKVAGWWLWGICAWIGSGWCSGEGPWQSVGGQLVKTDRTTGGRGINRKRVHLGDGGIGINRRQAGDRGDYIREWMRLLCERLRDVRVCCGDWARVLGASPIEHNGLTGIFLDPPYNHDERGGELYTFESDVADAVREWAVANGDNPMLRIALCGYDGEHEMPDTWECVTWVTGGGYSNQGGAESNVNRKRERVWFSPACLRPASGYQLSLLEA